MFKNLKKLKILATSASLAFLSLAMVGSNVSAEISNPETGKTYSDTMEMSIAEGGDRFWEVLSDSIKPTFGDSNGNSGNDYVPIPSSFASKGYHDQTELSGKCDRIVWRMLAYKPSSFKGDAAKLWDSLKNKQNLYSPYGKGANTADKAIIEFTRPDGKGEKESFDAKIKKETRNFDGQEVFEFTLDMPSDLLPKFFSNEPQEVKIYRIDATNQTRKYVAGYGTIQANSLSTPIGLMNDICFWYEKGISDRAEQ